MRTSHLWSLASAFTFTFAGCAFPAYQPLQNGVGYSEVEVGKDRYEIMFHGTSDQDELMAKKYALVRAAEIGKRNGFAYFSIDNGKTKEKEDTETVRESESQSVPDDPYYHPYPARRRKTETRTITRTETRPVIKIVVHYAKEACPDCLSVDGKIREAVDAGILKK